MEENGPTKINKLLPIAIAVLLIVGVAFGYFYSYVGNKEVVVPPDAPTYLKIGAENKDYIEARESFKNGAYEDAVTKYADALKKAKNPSEEMLLKIRIAQATEWGGDKLKAIDLYKEIIADPKFASDSKDLQQGKSNAVMGLMYIFNETYDKKITDKIFTGAHYQNFIKSDDADIDLAYRRLLEYANSFTSIPNLLAEAELASLYAQEVYNLKIKSSLTSEELSRLTASERIVKTKLDNINKHADNSENYYQYSRESTRPSLLRYKAEAVGLMFSAGYKEFGDPEKIFLQALSLPQFWRAKSQTKFSYATFLARSYGEKRKSDISPLLSDLYKTTFPENFSWRELLLNQRDHLVPRMETNLLLLAKVDSKFKDLLNSLGWRL